MDIAQNANGVDCRLSGCLFFTTNKLARELGRLAEDSFGKTGLSPSHAVLLYIVNLRGEIQQKEMGELLHLTPSTITRLLDKLERRGYIQKQLDGKSVCLRATPEGLAQQEQIVASWNQLHEGYQNILTAEEMEQFLKTSSKLLEHLANKLE